MKFQNHTKFQKYQISMQHVCFDCRKVFKKTFDVLGAKEERKICPECGERLYLAGTAFKAPKKEDKRQWDKVKLLITNGFVFYRRNLRIPLKTPREAVAFLEKHGIRLPITKELKNRKSLIDRKKTG